jgi:hypothetical protein
VNLPLAPHAQWLLLAVTAVLAAVALGGVAVPLLHRLLARRLAAGDRVRLGGGLGGDTAWLAGQPACTGTCVAFIPGLEGVQQPAAVVELDAPLRVDGVEGRWAVLQLRRRDAFWSRRTVVQVELCEARPEPKPWRERSPGRWVESAATCERVARALASAVSSVPAPTAKPQGAEVRVTAPAPKAEAAAPKAEVAAPKAEVVAKKAEAAPKAPVKAGPRPTGKHASKPPRARA